MARYCKRIVQGVYQINLLVLCFAQLYTGDKCTAPKQRDGICLPLEQCQNSLDELKRGVMPVNCGFEGFNPIVCCPIMIDPAVADTSPQPTQPTPVGAANYWCRKYIDLCPEKHGIAGGVRSLPREFPHMAAIGYGEENNIQWLCGGTLISDKFVLTAAHCLSAGQVGPVRWVLLGSESLVNRSADGRKGQIHPVVRRIRHPEYKPPSKYNDVALLEIGSSITPGAVSTVSRYLHPACLPMSNRSYTSYKGIATGWGRTGHAEDGSPELLKVQLDIFDSSKCKETFDVEIRTTNWLKRGIDNTMICAGVLEGGKDTCQGDSGGPLQMTIRESCIYEIWGITSFGKVCAFANSPAIYMRVSKYVPWIESIVWP